MSRKAVFLGLLLLLVVGVVIERLVVTDREALEAWADAAAEAVEEGDRVRLTELLSPDFEMGRFDRAQTVTRALRVRRDQGVVSVSVELHNLEIEGDTAAASAHIEAISMGRLWTLESRLTFARFSEGWALTAAEPVEPAIR